MAIQSQPQIGDNIFVVVSLVPWSGDPTRNIVTLQGLVPSANTNASAIGQSYSLSNTTLNSNNNGGVIINPVSTGFYPLGR